MGAKAFTGVAWCLPPAAFLLMGVYYWVSSGWHYVADFRLFFGHGYVLYAYTMVVFGAYGLVLAWRHGRRGFFLFVLLGIGCDMAQTFFNPVPNPRLPQIFTTNYALTPLFWVTGGYAAWRLCMPLKVEWVSKWTVGMLLLWLFSSQVMGILNSEALLQPTTEISWVVVSFVTVKPA